MASGPAPQTGPIARRSGVAYLLGLAVLLLFVAVAIAALTMARVTADTDLVEHTLVVEATTNRLAAFNEQVETGRRGFIIDGTSAFRSTVEGAAANLRTTTAELRILVADNAEQSRRAAEIAALAAERERILSDLFANGFGASNVIARGTFNDERGVAIVRRIREIATEMTDTEAALLRERNRAQFNSLVQLYVVGGAALALLIVILVAVIVLILRYNRRLDAAQALLLATNEILEEAVTQRTTELQRANQEIQRFAYIVSHDLRSPLVNVLGFTAEMDEARKTIRKYLEEKFEQHPALRDDAVWLAVDEDLPEALRFIRASTEKMDRLINSILALSRQGRRTLMPEHLDLDQLVGGVVASLHQRIVDAGATVTVHPLPPLESDRVAIEQLLSNLIENAIKYLNPARAGEVDVSGRTSGDRVEIDVSDNGRGIAPEDHERIFELFRRSGTQDQPGEGIGLANVRALAYRLGGLIELQSELDRGARFRLSLPARFIALDLDE
jgi:signal transduction histidine kinase